MDESCNTYSESSSVRMEREMMDESLARSPPTTTTNTTLSPLDDNDPSESSLLHFDSEIQRMSRDADALLDSILNQGSSPPRIMEDDGDNDLLSDEEQRLESVSTKLRESIDRNDDKDVLPDVTSPLDNSAIARQKELLLESSRKQLPKTNDSPSTPSGTPQQDAATTPTVETPAKQSNLPTTIIDEKQSPCVTSLGNDAVHFDALRLATALVWLLILVWIGHAKYRLVDAHGVVVQFPY